DIGLGQVGVLFSQYGGIVIGLVELLAGAIILYSPTRWFGALLGLGVISGAIFFHLFTPLGLFPYTDLACTQVGCPTEKALFFMALGVWLCCATLLLRLRSTTVG
ncbi:MAG: HTTM domain-containing protein, partial [Pseudomonadales bacterium]|nr:HTTM domain-containing protein [Pseudomonadales bacterium]